MGGTKLTFVQFFVHIVLYTLPHSADQMSHCQTAQGDWRCGCHSDGPPSQVASTSGHKTQTGARTGSHQNSSSELSASSMAWSWRLVPGSRGCWGRIENMIIFLYIRYEQTGSKDFDERGEKD